MATPVINLGYAQYQGTVNTTTNITTFLGIRYAAPPIGDLRFRAPQSPPDVTGVQQATTQPNQCFQAGDGTSATNPLKPQAVDVLTSEHCLFLSRPGFCSAISKFRGDPSKVVIWGQSAGLMRYFWGSVTGYFWGPPALLSASRHHLGFAWLAPALLGHHRQGLSQAKMISFI
ncbi:Alpha/Beta hydrolase protein [Mycena albidolilacea]|uniref:Carboxylic ester hydrolase n=1 Tax=Mycena albidolilacea TaxID=1033008 RepID=A0AAD6ZAH2_9AGAR|nr:Alpha/Beta hydrolase protein [Mycena albidolilacea]